MKPVNPLLPSIRLILFTVAVAVTTLNILAAADGMTTPAGAIDSEIIQRGARYDAIDDFNYRPWVLKYGAGEYCILFLVTGTSLVPDYPYRSKLVEFTLITGIPAYLSYKKKVNFPLRRSNQIALESAEYRQLYISEYEAATRQLRIINTFTGMAVFAVAFTVVKAILPS